MGVNFFLADKNKEKTSIYAIVRFKSRRYKKSTGESIKAIHWNNGWSREIREYPHGKALNVKLKKFKRACEQVCDESIELVTIPDEITFWKKVDLALTGKTVEYTFIAYLEDYIGFYELGLKNCKDASIGLIIFYTKWKSILLKYWIFLKQRECMRKFYIFTNYRMFIFSYIVEN